MGTERDLVVRAIELSKDYVRVLKIKRDPKCPVCSDHPTQTGLIDYEAFCGLAAAPSAGAAAANGHAEAAPAGR